ncbi:MAG: hypothetical protein AB7T49_07790 [Oligoflexales bacterium]
MKNHACFTASSLLIFLISCSSEPASFRTGNNPVRGETDEGFDSDSVAADEGDIADHESNENDDYDENSNSEESQSQDDTYDQENDETADNSSSDPGTDDDVLEGDQNETSEENSPNNEGESNEGETPTGKTPSGESTDGTSDNSSTSEQRGPGIPPGDVAEICNHQENLKKVFKQIKFNPPTSACAWGQDGNLTKLDSVVRARREQIQNLDLTGSNVICSVAFNLPQQQINFDDEIFLIFNNYVLAASRDYTYALPEKNGMYLYDWKSLVNQPYQAVDTQNYYCLGDDQGLGSCVMPYTQTTGALELRFDDSLLQNISALSSLTDHSFGLVTIGDNNPTDCIHTGLTFDVTVRYAPITK